MEEKTLRVEVLLSSSQQRKGDRWAFTHDGEEKLVKESLVQFYVENKTKALEALKLEEVCNVWFDGIPYNLDSGEPKDYYRQLCNAQLSVSKAVHAGIQLDGGREGRHVNHKFILDECIAASADLRIVINKLKSVIARNHE